MKFRLGITGKLFALYIVFFLVFLGTTIVFYVNVTEIVARSEEIVSKNNEIASRSKQMIENLLSMEEYHQKYVLLNNDEYWRLYQSARKEFEANLNAVLNLKTSDAALMEKWQALESTYLHFYDQAEKGASFPEKKIWIPESFVNKWIQAISAAREKNEENIEAALQEINQQSRSAARYGLIGLFIAVIFGGFGSLFLAKSMIRPLKELMQGIRSFSKERMSETIQIRYRDELGELTDAFNDMTRRLKREENMRSDFISMLSHEIRTPLTSIRESVNMIFEEVMGTVNERQKKFLKIASSEIGRISELLNHMMQVSRMEVKALEVQPRPVDPYELVSKSIDHLKTTAQAKNITFNLQVPNDAPKVMCTPEHLHQVFLNILGNAIKFTDQGGSVGIHVIPDKKGENLTFAIEDSGPGISEEDQALIFNKYYRAKDVRGHMDGVGLGLSISRQIIVAHGGNIWVKSEVGAGSVFGFTLPAAVAE
ncbi:MAG: ATP-binding protein [Desulfobacterales bacterium]|nr:ATP-binding protein [Desulfobacterales bacterium]